MTFTIDHSDPALIALAGDVLGGADALAFSHALDELIRSGARKVVIDLGGVGLINSSGLGMLVAASKSVRLAGGRIAVVTQGGQIRDLLKMTRLDTIIAPYSSRQEALNALAGQ